MEFDIFNITKESIDRYIDDLVCIDNDVSEELGQSYGNQIWDIGNFMKDLPKKWDYSFLVLSKDRICGFAINSQMLQNELHINKFAISKQHRNMGIGSMLIKNIVDTANSDNCSAITVETSKMNAKARKFYESNGFIQMTGDALKEYVNKRKDTSRVKCFDGFTREQDNSEFVILKKDIVF